MKTNFEITIAIDEESLNVSYAFPNKKQKETIEELSLEDNKAIENYSDLQSSLELMVSKNKTNEELIPLLEGEEKAEVLKENREVLKAIEELTPKVKTAAKVQLEHKANDKRFEILVSGDDKTKLSNIMKEKNISSSRIMEEIYKGVAKATEKK